MLTMSSSWRRPTRKAAQSIDFRALAQQEDDDDHGDNGVCRVCGKDRADEANEEEDEEDRDLEPGDGEKEKGVPAWKLWQAILADGAKERDEDEDEDEDGPSTEAGLCGQCKRLWRGVKRRAARLEARQRQRQGSDWPRKPQDRGRWRRCCLCYVRYAAVDDAATEDGHADRLDLLSAAVGGGLGWDAAASSLCIDCRQSLTQVAEAERQLDRLERQLRHTYAVGRARRREALRQERCGPAWPDLLARGVELRLAADLKRSGAGTDFVVFMPGDVDGTRAGGHEEADESESCTATQLLDPPPNVALLCTETEFLRLSWRPHRRHVALAGDLSDETRLIRLEDASQLMALHPRFELIRDQAEKELRISSKGVWSKMSRLGPPAPSCKQPFACSKCAATHGDFSALWLHLLVCRGARRQNRATKNRVEEKSKVIKCVHCEKTFDREIDYLKHLESAHDGRPYKEPGSLSCDQCPKTFYRADHLQAHLRTHRGQKPFLCAVCGKSFTRKASWLEHNNRHKGIKDKQCPLCLKHFYSTSFWRHMSTVHPDAGKLVHACSVCGRKFGQLFRLRLHEKTHLTYEQREFVCEQCPEKRFATGSRLRSHVMQVHEPKSSDGSDDHVKLCPDCGLKFQSSGAMEAHRKRHHLDSCSLKHQCDGCSMSFVSASLLKSHQEAVHAQEQIYPVVPQEQQQQQQQQQQQISFQKQPDNKAGSFIEQPLPYTACISLPEISAPTAQSALIQATLTEPTVPDVSSSQPVEMSSAEMSAQHLMTISPDEFLGDDGDILIAESLDSEAKGQTTCASELQGQQILVYSSAEGSFALSSAVSTDAVTVAIEAEAASATPPPQPAPAPPPEGVRDGGPFGRTVTEPKARPLVGKEPAKNSTRCEKCGKDFSTAKAKQQHLKNIHSELPPVSCRYCDRTFATAQYLKDHEKIHTTDKSFECDECQKTFRLAKELTRHRRVHTGEKPYKCEFCSKSFSSSSNLCEHRTLHTGRMPYECPKCGQSFRLWTAMNKHSSRCVQTSSDRTDLSTTTSTRVFLLNKDAELRQDFSSGAGTTGQQQDFVIEEIATQQGKFRILASETP